MSRTFRALLASYSIAFEVVTWTLLVPMTLVRIVMRRASIEELRERLAITDGAFDDPARNASRGVGVRRSGLGVRRSGFGLRRSGLGLRKLSVLVHAVSAGEMTAAEPLVRILAGLNRRVLLSTGTSAGMAIARRIAASHAHVDACRYAPWDRRHVRDWLRVLDPSAVIVMETEIWPNLFAACAALSIPLVIANGRVGASDVPRYRLARRFFRQVLAGVAWIGAQSLSERDRFLQIGADPSRVGVAGNLKRDASLPSLPLPAPVAADLGRSFTIVAGSTHAPEEAILVDAQRALTRRGYDVRLVLAPRDVARTARLARLARLSRGCSVACWSAIRRDGDTPWDVLLVDEFGWLPSFYAAADAVFLGGTIAPVGGHNVHEPARLGRAILVGPHVNGIEAAVAELDAAGGIIRLPDARTATFADACERLARNPGARDAIGRAARAATASDDAVARTYFDVMRTLIPAIDQMASA